MSAKRVTTIAVVIVAILVAAVTLSLTLSKGTGPLGGSAAGNSVGSADTGSSNYGAAASANGSSDSLGQPVHPDWPPPAAGRPLTTHLWTEAELLAYPYRFVPPAR